MNKMNNKNKFKNIGVSPINITIFDHPNRQRLGLSTLVKQGEEDNRIEDGALVSEVGECIPISIKTVKDTIMAFPLRKVRNIKVPSFIWGSCRFGDAYSALIPKTFAMPAVGSKIVIQPWSSWLQGRIVRDYNYFRYDVTWIIHIPSPLGTGVYVKVFAPELDEKTETRGIRWKPAACPSLAVHCPYSNDLSLVPVVNPRPGQSGGAIVIENLEDNSVETLNTPLQITLWCIVHNISATGFNKDNLEADDTLKGLEFKPITVPAVIEEQDLDNSLLWDKIVYEADEESASEVNAEGGVVVSELPVQTPAVPLAPVVEEQAKPAKQPNNKTSKSKNDTGHIDSKWIDWQTFTINSEDLMKWKTITLNPYTFTNKGEAFNLAWKRNVWHSGQRDEGTVHTVVVQMNIARSPQISGVLQIQDSTNNSNHYLVQFGEKVEIPLIPDKLNGKINSPDRPRYFNNPWLLSSESTVTFKYRLVAFNRTADISDVRVKLSIRPGFSVFQTPIKPKPRQTPNMVLDWDKFYTQQTLMPVMEYQIDESIQHLVTQTIEHVAPVPGYSAEMYSLADDAGDQELLDLDEFPVVLETTLKRGEITEIPLNLPSIVDAFGSSENAISQKFERFAHIVPTGEGAFGPVVGDYTIHTRLPTNIAASISHVALPGDMNTEAAILIFGLENILSMAGSAIASVGGPILGGFINTVAPVVSGIGHAIGGEAIGGVVDKVIDTGVGALNNIFGSLTGSKATNQQPPEPTQEEKRQPSANPSVITGQIPISRYVEFLKPVLENYTTDPVLGSLLVSLVECIGGDGKPIEEIPIKTLVNMRTANVERNLINREVVPASEFKNYSLVIPSDGFSKILEAFNAHPNTNLEGSMQNIWYKRFMTVLNTNLRARKPLKNISMQEVKQAPVNFDISAQSLTNEFADLIKNY